MTLPPWSPFVAPLLTLPPSLVPSPAHSDPYLSFSSPVPPSSSPPSVGGLILFDPALLTPRLLPNSLVPTLVSPLPAASPLSALTSHLENPLWDAVGLTSADAAELESGRGWTDLSVDPEVLCAVWLQLALDEAGGGWGNTFG